MYILQIKECFVTEYVLCSSVWDKKKNEAKIQELFLDLEMYSWIKG